MVRRSLAHPGELHLTPLHAVLQMRPSMQHVDMLGQAESSERRGGRGAGSDDEGDANNAPDKRPGVVSLNVSVRTDASRPGPGAGRAPHDARDADAERWVDLRWIDESDPRGRQLADEQLLTHTRAPLYCESRARDFL